MKRITPRSELSGYPCFIVGISCAKGMIVLGIDGIRDDGYTTLQVANKHIRKLFTIKKRYNYKRGERPLLKDLHIDGKALVCVYGHFVYVEGETYYSFFDNENDEVVSMWVLAD